MTSRIANPLRARASALSGLEEQPLGTTPAVLIVSHDASTGRLLGDTIRDHVDCRVLLASGIAEAQYLVAVEGNIRVMLADSLSNEHIALARWFLTTQPATTVLVAGGSLWKLTGGPARCEQMLLAKTYSPDELASTVRALVIRRRNTVPERFARLKDAA